MQILVDQPSILEVTFTDTSGDPADLDALPTLTVKDGSGTSVTTGSVTKPAGTTGIYRATLAGQAKPTVLTATWTGALSGDTVVITQRYEVVADLLFTESQARGFQVSGGQTPLSDTTLFDDDWIADLRARISDQFERKAGRSFVRRYCRAVFAGSGDHSLPLWEGRPRLWDGTPLDRPGRAADVAEVLSVTVGGTTVDPSNVVIDGGILHRTDGVWSSPSIGDPLNVVAEWVYGLPAPAEAQARALQMAAANVPGDLSAWAVSFSNDDGSMRFDRPLAYPPEVFEWLKSQTVRLGIG